MVDIKKRGIRKKRVGTVIRKSGDKSIVVLVETRRPHPIYGKVVKYERKFHVHDEKNEAKIGDKIAIMETRPLSKNKRWRLVAFISRNLDEQKNEKQG